RTWLIAAPSDGRWPMTDEIGDQSDVGHRTSDIGHRSSVAICVAIDILDEDHSLRLAMRRLAGDADLRAQLGRAGREWWAREHSVDAMADDYERVMRDAATRPPSPEASARQGPDQ